MKTPIAVFALLCVLCDHSPAADAPAVQVETRTAIALGVAAMNVSGAVQPRGLATEFYFHYRLVGVNATGASFGDDAQFQTPRN